MKVILANDGISQQGIDLLGKAGFKVNTTRVAQGQLANFINANKIIGLLVRSATTVDREIIDACPGLRLIGRGGVGMDNIDVEHARSKGIHVINTPTASVESVAELVMAHLLGATRFLHEANRAMPLEGDLHFKLLKKSFANGLELRGRTLGIIGFGRIGQATAKKALALGMKVIFTDHDLAERTLELPFYDGRSLSFVLEGTDLDSVLKDSDFVSLHVPAQNKPLIGKREIALMRPGAGIINTSRGGVVDEKALVEALDADHLGFAALDVYESEPHPAIKVLMNPKISLSPHIGASTMEAQGRIGEELALQLIEILK